MNRTRKWIAAAALLLGAGVLLGIVALAALRFDFRKLSTVQYETKTFSIENEFQDIRIDADIENIVLAPSEDGGCRVVCDEEEKYPHEVYVENDTLTIVRERERWRWNLGIIIVSPKITVYLPEMQYGALSVDVDTGDITIPRDFSFESIRLSLDTGDANCFASASGDITIEVDTGEVVLEDVTCKNFASKGNTGRLRMTNVTAAEAFRLERDTGDIRFDRCDAETIYAKTDTGSVTGTLRTDKVFHTETDIGSVRVPNTTTGGRCEITTDTGDIRIEIAQ